MATIYFCHEVATVSEDIVAIMFQQLWQYFAQILQQFWHYCGQNVATICGNIVAIIFATICDYNVAKIGYKLVAIVSQLFLTILCNYFATHFAT